MERKEGGFGLNYQVGIFRESSSTSIKLKLKSSQSNRNQSFKNSHSNFDTINRVVPLFSL